MACNTSVVAFLFCARSACNDVYEVVTFARDISVATGVLGFFAKASLMSLADDFESAVRISVGVFGLPANFWRTPVFLSLPRD